MPKAVFLDYTGTILQTDSDDLRQLANRMAAGNFKSPQEAADWWLSTLRTMEENAYRELYAPQEVLALRVLEKAAKEKGLKDDLLQLRQLNINYWMYAPLYSDVKRFFEQCPLPIYIISNNSDSYIRICLRRNGLHVNGIISADQVRAYKPHRELYDLALRTAQVEAKEAVCIGDSLVDMIGASSVGMKPVLLDRKKNAEIDAYRIVHSLSEALRLL